MSQPLEVGFFSEALPIYIKKIIHMKYFIYNSVSTECLQQHHNLIVFERQHCQPLLDWRNSFLLLNAFFYPFYCIRWFYINFYLLSSQSFDLQIRPYRVKRRSWKLRQGSRTDPARWKNQDYQKTASEGKYSMSQRVRNVDHEQRRYSLISFSNNFSVRCATCNSLWSSYCSEQYNMVQEDNVGRVWAEAKDTVACKWSSKTDPNCTGTPADVKNEQQKLLERYKPFRMQVYM